jgi:asparagine synthetase B (glutamine-hydrolysing)
LRKGRNPTDVRPGGSFVAEAGRVLFYFEKALSVSNEQPQVIVGSRTCAHVLYLSMIDGQLVASNDIEDVLIARHRAGAAIGINHAAVSHLLHDGFVPPPLTVYRDIFAISVDLRAEVKAGAISFVRDFPFENHKSSLDGIPDTGSLLLRLGQATKAASAESHDVLLMLSSGLDSTSLAVAAKEAGRDDILCVTYGESADDTEVIVARDTCRRLGLRHETHMFDARDPRIRTDLVTYGESVPQPCADPALAACVSLVRRFASSRNIILDGSGNDYYFWRPPRRLDLLKTWLGLGRFPVVDRLRPLLPMQLRGERILASPLELLLLNGVWLRYSETQKFYPDAVDTHKYWLGESRTHDFAREELQHCLKMIYMGPAAFMMKTRNAAQSVGATAHFPWADDAVADYCFSLPEEARFDRRRRKSKTIIRKMLREALSYDASIVGKHHFSFGKRNFLRHQLSFCRDEILGCTLWSRGVERTFQHLADLLERGQQAENALLSMFTVSLWHNRWLARNFAGLLRSHRPAGLRNPDERKAEEGSPGIRKLAS